MSCQAETSFVGAVIDGQEFARARTRLVGRVAVVSLPRLADVLADDSGVLECEVRGEVDKEGKFFLLLAVSGVLSLRCQRCLGVVAYELELASRLLLVADGDAWPDEELEDDTFDAVAAGRAMEVLPLVEEEVLLALPVAPRHEDCRPPAAVETEQRPSPFGVLAGLKKH